MLSFVLHPVAVLYRIIEQNHYEEKYDIWNLFAISNAGILVTFEVWLFLQDFNDHFYVSAAC